MCCARRAGGLLDLIPSGTREPGLMRWHLREPHQARVPFADEEVRAS